MGVDDDVKIVLYIKQAGSYRAPDEAEDEEPGHRSIGKGHDAGNVVGGSCRWLGRWLDGLSQHAARDDEPGASGSAGEWI